MTTNSLNNISRINNIGQCRSVLSKFKWYNPFSVMGFLCYFSPKKVKYFVDEIIFMRTYVREQQRIRKKEEVSVELSRERFLTVRDEINNISEEITDRDVISSKIVLYPKNNKVGFDVYTYSKP